MEGNARRPIKAKMGGMVLDDNFGRTLEEQIGRDSIDWRDGTVTSERFKIAGI